MRPRLFPVAAAAALYVHASVQCNLPPFVWLPESDAIAGALYTGQRKDAMPMYN